LINYYINLLLAPISPAS